MRTVQEKPVKVEFRSIFTPLQGSSEPAGKPIQDHKKRNVQSCNTLTTVQRMKRSQSQVKSQEQGAAQVIPTLEKGILNVVREEHLESDTRRDMEKEYSEKCTNSPNYFVEVDFREHLNTAYPDIQEVVADSYKKVIITLLKSLQLGSNELLKLEFPFMKFPRPLNAVIESFRKIITTQIYTARTLWILLEKINSGAGELEFTKEEKENISPSITQQLKNVGATLYHTYDHNYSIFKLNGVENFPEPSRIKENSLFWIEEQLITQVQERFREQTEQRRNVLKYPQENYKLGVDTLVVTIKKKNLISDSDLASSIEELRKERSELMHNTASKYCKKEEGVWKTGDRHVTDIKEKYKDRDYNLLNRADFNTNFNEYLESKKKKEAQSQKHSGAFNTEESPEKKFKH